jgi:hypothetical protein
MKIKYIHIHINMFCVCNKIYILFPGGIVFARRMRQEGYLTMYDPFQQKYGNIMVALLYVAGICGDLFWSASVLAALGTLSINIRWEIYIYFGACDLPYLVFKEWAFQVTCEIFDHQRKCYYIVSSVRIYALRFIGYYIVSSVRIYALRFSLLYCILCKNIRVMV